MTPYTPSLVLPSMEVQPSGLALSDQGLANYNTNTAGICLLNVCGPN